MTMTMITELDTSFKVIIILLL